MLEFLNLLILAPFAFVGIYKFVMIFIDIIRVRRGQIKVVKRLGNDRITSFWKKPKGNNISIDGVEKGIRLDKDWCYFTSSFSPIPTIYLDNHNNQIQIKTEAGEVPTEEYEKMYNLAYEAGRASSFKEEKRAQLFFLFVLIGIACMIGGIVYLNLQFTDVISQIAELKLAVTNLPGSMPVIPPA